MKGFPPLASLIALFSALTLSSYALTTSGIISQEETWSGEVVLTGDVTVASGGKLTILPGTVVKCQPKTDDQQSGDDGSLIELIINGGELVASGTESKHITFTSAAESPEKGDWYGIRHVKGRLTLRYCDESFGVIGLQTLNLPKAVEYCRFENNSSTGLHFENGIRAKGCKVRSGDDLKILYSLLACFYEVVYLEFNQNSEASKYDINS